MAFTTDIIEDVTEGLVIERLTKEMKEQARMMGRTEARFLVDTYYQVQEGRKRANNQLRAGLKPQTDEPAWPLMEWIAGHQESLEDRIRSLLGEYARAQRPGRWALSVHGIGPVISAGLLAHIDITKAYTAGHIWSFAGLNPDAEWYGRERAAAIVKEVAAASVLKGEGLLLAVATHAKRSPTFLNAMLVDRKTGERKAPTVTNLSAALAKRPWNAALKTLCWKASQSFVKVHNSEKDFYGHLYAQRKQVEIAANDAGQYADQAAMKLEKYRIGQDTEAFKWYSIGKLPPAHIEARACRWTVKLFLSHWHRVAFECEFGRVPPPPYILTLPGHAHPIEPPGWPCD